MNLTPKTVVGLLAACLCTSPVNAQAPCTGDLNADRVVDGLDLGILLADWGDAGVADLNADGFVDGVDLGMLLAAWGACPVVTPTWATLIEAAPDPAVVTDPVLRQRISATGWAWRVRYPATQIEMLLVPPGTFQMGCIMGSNLYECDGGELPVRQVTLTNAFYLGRYEVTQSQWEASMGTDPWYFRSASSEVPADQVWSRPVEKVSWNTVQGFLSSTGMRLPTEAEWEYACRAGTQTPFYNGSTDDSTLGALAWYHENAVFQTRPVGGKAANALGFHDMLGNVSELVNNWYGSYSAEPQINPTGPASGTVRIARGSSYRYGTGFMRSSARNQAGPDSAYSFLGFRVARNP